MGLLASTAGSIVAAGGDTRLASLLLVLVLAAGPMLLRNFLRRIYFANKQFERALVLDGAVAALQFLGLAVLLFTGQMSASSALIMWAVACALPSVVSFALSGPTATYSRTRALLDLRHNLEMAKWLLLSGLLWMLALEAYPWVIMTLQGPAETAYYGVAIAIANALNALIAGLHNYIGPNVAHSQIEEQPEAFRRTIVRMLLLTLALVASPCVLIALFHESVILRLYGAPYMASGPILVALLLGLVGNALSFPLTRVFFALGRGDLDFWINTAALALLLPLGSLLVWWFGALGGGIGVLLTQSMAFLARLVVSLRMLRKPVPGPQPIAPEPNSRTRQRPVAGADGS
jgi:O-antigen/teichoic acid export membrane protein